MEIDSWMFTEQEARNIKKRLKDLRELFLLHKSDFNLTTIKKLPFLKLEEETKNNTFLNEHYNSFKKKNMYIMSIRICLEIYNNREKGELVCIDRKYLRDSSYIYTKHKYFAQNTNDINLYKHILEKYHFIDYLDNFFEEYINDETNTILRQINNVENPKTYINTILDNVCNILLNLNKLKEKSEEYDIKNYNLIIEKITIALKNLTYSYFEYLNQPTKNKIKTINPHFINFFENKDSEKSFEIHHSNFFKLSEMRKSLIHKGYIEDINNNSFVKIFDDTDILQRINWIGKKGLLVYFIKQLVDKKIVVKPKKLWKKTSICFLYKGKVIDYNKIKTSNPSKNLEEKRSIDAIIKKLT